MTVSKIDMFQTCFRVWAIILTQNISVYGTGSGNHKVTQFVPLELEINGYTENINIVVIDSNSIDIFLEHDQLVKYNLGLN